MKTGIANLPLHPGKCPVWLFRRMKRMAGAITDAVVTEYGQEEFLRRLSDPFWFQALGCVLGFDWHSSGLTTTVCGALKEGVNREETGIFVCGGKGARSRMTPDEIYMADLPERKTKRLIRASKLSAKVDNAAVQDGYRLYHHTFVFTEKGRWAVIQQGLNRENRYARRYHWLSETMDSFVNEPHRAVCCDEKRRDSLNMVAEESTEARKASLDLVKDGPNRFLKYLEPDSLKRFLTQEKIPVLNLPENHLILNMHKRNMKTLEEAYEIQPQTYEQLLSIRGFGPKCVRALALVSQVIYGKPASWKDPVKYSFAHGGKDGIPYPVDRDTYDKSIEILRTGLEEARMGQKEKLAAVQRLERFF